jgi:putative Mn2+ efflux pump MntP
MLSVLLIGVSLSMDAFAISVTNGLTLRNFRLRHALWIGAYFGFFQFMMPLAGCYLAGTVSGFVEALGPYISFFLLSFIGGKMIWDSLCGGDEAGMSLFSHRRLLAMAVATSIDALAVGVSFAFMDVKLLPSCAVIGCTTFFISFAGALLGSRIPGIRGGKAGLIGGLVLIGIGVKLLAEGVFL